MNATVTCSVCQNRIDITPMLNADLRLLCDALTEDNRIMRKALENITSPLDLLDKDAEIEQLQQALVHQLDQRIAAMQLRTAARSVCDYLAAEPDCCPSLSLEARIEQLARALATEDHGDA